MKSFSQKVPAEGGKGGVIWDDGLHTRVKKVCVGTDATCVTYVKFKYIESTSTETKSYKHGIINQRRHEFELEYPYEYLKSVEGTYAQPANDTVITSLDFITSSGKKYEFGNQKFVLANFGQKLIGFHGRVALGCLDALGAYFVPVPVTNSSPTKVWIPPKKLEAQGGPGGEKWDDGIYEDVRKIYVGRDQACVTSIMFDYVKGNRTETRAHGLLNEELQEFLLDPAEYITSVEGRYGKVRRFDNPVITSLAFTTSTGRTSPTFGATKFVLEDNNRQIVGFHGRSETALDSIGAHFMQPFIPHVGCCIS